MQQVQELISQLSQTQEKANIIIIFQQLDDKLKQHNLQVMLFQGDNIIQKIITLFDEYLNELNISEMKTCRNLLCHTLQHKEFVSHESAANIYKYAVQILIQDDKQREYILIAFIGILMDFFQKINVHYYDPRRDRNDVFIDQNNQKRSLKNVFQAIQQIYQKLSVSTSTWKKELIIQLLNSINYESPQIIEQYFEYYFDNESIIIKELNPNTSKEVLFQALKTVAQACRAAKKQLKHAELSERSQYISSQKDKQAECIKHLLVRIQELYRGYDDYERDLQKQLNYTFTNILQQINYFNIKVDFYQYINKIITSIQDNSQRTVLKLKLSQIILDLLKQDIYDLIIFNTHKQGQYYMNHMNSFKQDFIYSVRYVLKYINSLEGNNNEKTKNNRQKSKQKNKFAVLVNVQEEIDNEEDIYITDKELQDPYLMKMHMQLINTYIANFPMLGLLADRYQEHMTSFLYKGENIVKKLITIMLEQDIIDVQNLCYFIQQLQHGCNMITNTLNVVRDSDPGAQSNQSKNMLFIQFYVNKLLNIKRGQMNIYTQELILSDINQIYEEIIIPGIKKMTEHKVDCYEYFSVIYHTPKQCIENRIDENLFYMIYNHVKSQIQRQLSVYKADIKMQQDLGRKLYAFQILAKTKMFQEGSSFQSGVEFLTQLLGKSNIQPNNKKPILQTLGSLINLNLITYPTVYLSVLKESQKPGRQQSTAIRILQFIIVQYDITLKIKQNIELQDIVDALKECVDGSKETTSYAALVVLQKIYQHWNTIYTEASNTQSDEHQLSNFKTQTTALNNGIVLCVTDKQMQMRQVYPNTLNNQFRKLQIEKYMIQVVNLLGSYPLYLLNISKYRVISSEFSAFIALFGYNKTPIMKAYQAINFFINAYEFDQELYKPEESIKKVIIDYLTTDLDYLTQDVERFQSNKKYYTNDEDFEPVAQQIEQMQQQIDQIKRKLLYFE